MDYKTIRVYTDTFTDLNTLCKKYKVSKTQLTEAMCNYFLKTHISPYDPTDVSTEVKKLKNQLIGFIRTQEIEKLNPLIKKQDLLIERFMTHLNDEMINREFMIQLAQKIVDKLKEHN